MRLLSVRPRGTACQAMLYSGREDREYLHQWMCSSAMNGDFGYVNREFMKVRPGDYVVRTTEGKFFRVSPDTFKATYEVDGGPV